MPKKPATIVTGGGRGIGRAIAEKMSAKTTVLLVGRNENSLLQAAEEINSLHGKKKAFYVAGDVSNPQTAEACLQCLKQNKLDLQNLVCCAGIGYGGAITDFPLEKWQEIFAVNVQGTFLFIKACLPLMLAKKSGNICIISSIAGLKGYKYQSAYCASKFALVGLAQSIALEHAKQGIVVVPICPSFVESDMTRQTIAGLMKHRQITEDEARNIIANTNPQRRIIETNEIAEAVSMVCSGKLPSMNGRPLVLSGGE